MDFGITSAGLQFGKDDNSGKKLTRQTARLKSTPVTFTPFQSLSYGSASEVDSEEMFELMEMSMDGEINSPMDTSSLITKDIESPQTSGKRNGLIIDTEIKSNLGICTTPDRHCFKAINENGTPLGQRNLGMLKRAEPATTSSQSKRHKSENEPPLSAEIGKLPKRPVFRKSVSMDDSNIHKALIESNLIGDLSRPFCLPLTDGGTELKSISAETMHKLLTGGFKDVVAKFNVIDCRYPYEYEAGHIAGALNLYTHQHILDELIKNKPETLTDSTKRSILVFHCEFSSQRGPKLLKFLREHDRQLNTYPSLHYPEMYLLGGGYKEFYETYPDLCEPQAYLPMLEPKFATQCKYFRAKVKSWAGETPAPAVGRMTRSRSRLIL